MEEKRKTNHYIRDEKLGMGTLKARIWHVFVCVGERMGDCAARRSENELTFEKGLRG